MGTGVCWAVAACGLTGHLRLRVAAALPGTGRLRPRKQIAGADTGRRPQNVPKAERRLRGAWVSPREGAGA